MTEQSDRDSHQEPDNQTPEPSNRARYIIILIGVGSFGLIICMCTFVFALALL